MKSTTLKCLAAITVFSALANPIRLAGQESNQKQIRYSVINLGTLGGTVGAAYGINNTGWVTGDANLPGDQNEHGFLWRKGVKTDLGTFGGPNSSAPGFQNDKGVIVGSAQTPEIDPLSFFLAYFCTASPCDGIDHISLPFRWQDGVMTALPTLGGYQGQAIAVNNQGRVVGVAENRTHDTSCVLPQRLDFEAVIWGPKGEIQELPPFPGDATGLAVAINDYGHAVGCSGTCGTTSFPAAVFGSDCVHATLWQNGSVTDLGGFGGAMNNAAVAINNRGQIAGLSDLLVTGPTEGPTHAFFWEKGVMTDLGTLPGDVLSASSGLNNKGQIVGQSCDANFNCRAFLWENGVMTDLNTLIPSGSSLSLIYGSDINDKGEISGQAFDPSTGDSPAFVAIPCDDAHAGDQGCQTSAQYASLPTQISTERTKIILPENIREMLRQRQGLRLGR